MTTMEGIEATASTSAPAAPKQVQILLTTQDPDPQYQVPAQPILVPLSLKRYGLSQVVNHLLTLPTPTSFDFILSGTFLRTSLDEYLTKEGLSSESLLRIEYVRSIRPPLHLASFEHEDWVSGVSVQGQRILSGSYDGVARVWDLSGNVLAMGEGHSMGVKSVRWVDESRFVTGGLDRVVKVWEYKDGEVGEGSIKCVGELRGHKGAVEDLVVQVGGGKVLSASGDHTINVWEMDLSAAPKKGKEDRPTKQMQAKRRRVAQSDVQAYAPILSFSGHTAPVQGVIFDGKDSTVAYSASWDHTIRTWDLPTGSLVDTRTTQHPLLSICALPSLSLLACGSSAAHITLHDPRSSEVATSLLKGHTNAVVGIVRSPENEFNIASAGHDGSVRIWDVRASGKGGDACVYVIKRESGHGKCFGVDWTKEAGIVSAGEDKRVQVNESIR